MHGGDYFQFSLNHSPVSNGFVAALPMGASKLEDYSAGPTDRHHMYPAL